ncbi:MAG TPA: cupin, partial [Allosphingosinicella sp.]
MTSPAKPVVAQTKPFYRELKAGRTYMWCQCGRSVRQPFCDGRSHIGTGFEPVAYTARADGEEVLFCGCKQTGTPPFCDGAHNNLPGGYKADARSEAEREALAWAKPDEAGFSRLDDRCYVVSPAATRPAPAPRFWCRTIVSPALGAVHQSQFYLELESGSSPVL